MDVLQDFNIKIYPTSITRFSFVYLKDDWTVALSGIFNNKSVYPMDSKPIRLITPSIQLSFTKHFYLKKKELPHPITFPESTTNPSTERVKMRYLLPPSTI